MNSTLAAFWAAFRLLTVLPVGARQSDEGRERALANSLAFFPLVGVLIGLASAGVFVAAAEAFPVAVAAALAVTTPVVLTGALHIDGLGDSFDGLLGGRTRERKLEIMADPRTGAFGVAAIVLALLVRWAVVSELDPASNWSVLVVAAVLSRGAVSAVVALFPYVRAQGIGAVYSNSSRLAVMTAVVTALALTAVFGNPASLIAAAVAFVIGALIAMYARRAIGGVTGDIYGAVVELSELSALLTLLALIEAGFDIGAIW